MFCFLERKMDLTKMNIFSRACYFGDENMVISILDDPYTGTEEINQTDDAGCTPLHYAVEGNQLDCVCLILAHPSTNRTIKNIEGETPLFLGCKNYDINIDIIKALIGPDLVTSKVHTNNYGSTPLLEAARKYRQDIIELLIANKADINAVDNNGFNCFDIAFPHSSIARFLLSNKELELTNEDFVGPTSHALGSFYIDNFDLMVRYIEKLVPREQGTHWAPKDILEPAFTCIIGSMSKGLHYVKHIPYLLAQSGYMNPKTNDKYPLLEFVLKNFSPSKIVMDEHRYLMPLYSQNRYISYFLLFALHQDLFPILSSVIEQFQEMTHGLCRSPKFNVSQRLFYLVMRSACNSDQHLEFAIEFHRDFIQAIDYDQHYFGKSLTHVLRWWVMQKPQIEKLRRACKLLEYFQSIGFKKLDSQNILSQLLQCHLLCANDGPKFSRLHTVAIQLLAPHYPAFWLKFRNYDGFIRENLFTLDRAYRGNCVPTEYDVKPNSTANVTLKLLCRQSVLEWHRNNIDSYFDNVSQLELPRELKDFLCFRLSDSDLACIMNEQLLAFKQK